MLEIENELKEFLLTDGGIEDYYSEKMSNKQRIVRNEFIKSGKYGIPLIKKQKIDLTNIKLLNYTKTKNKDEQNKDKTFIFLLMIGNLKKYMINQKM